MLVIMSLLLLANGINLLFWCKIIMAKNNSVKKIEKNACYDCGSTILKHHTKLCDLSEKNDILDLPHISGTQYWDKSS